jgi:hypothetical protein
VFGIMKGVHITQKGFDAMVLTCGYLHYDGPFEGFEDCLWKLTANYARRWNRKADSVFRELRARTFLILHTITKECGGRGHFLFPPFDAKACAWRRIPPPPPLRQSPREAARNWYRSFRRKHAASDPSRPQPIWRTPRPLESRARDGSSQPHS